MSTRSLVPSPRPRDNLLGLGAQPLLPSEKMALKRPEDPKDLKDPKGEKSEKAFLGALVLLGWKMLEDSVWYTVIYIVIYIYILYTIYT